MEAATEVPRNGKAKVAEQEPKVKVSRPRTRRQAPITYKQDEVKEPIVQLRKVATKGVAFERVTIGELFALTADGESINMKCDRTCARPWGGELFDCRGVTVYVYVR